MPICRALIMLPYAARGFLLPFHCQLPAHSHARASARSAAHDATSTHYVKMPMPPRRVARANVTNRRERRRSDGAYVECAIRNQICYAVYAARGWLIRKDALQVCRARSYIRDTLRMRRAMARGRRSTLLLREASVTTDGAEDAYTRRAAARHATRTAVYSQCVIWSHASAGRAVSIINHR